MKGVVLMAAVSLVVSVVLGDQTTAAQAVFRRTTSCATSCPAATKFQYQNSMVHVFDYHASTKFLSGSREPQLGVSARAHVTVAGQCEMILAISHVRLVDSLEQNQRFSADLIRNPLRFGFLDGRVVSVCPADDESRWVLNFKRAVLSTFQNSMTKFDDTKEEWLKETDVNGFCSSTYQSVQQEPGIYNVTRSRGSTCVPPEPAPTANIFNSLLQKIPMVFAEQKCLQMISGGSLKEAVCKENVRLPWYSNDDQPMATLTTSLKLVYQFKADFVVIPNYEATRLSLALEWEDTSDDEAPADWLVSALDLIKSLEESIPTPSRFYRLASLLKKFNYSQFTDVFAKIAPDLWSTAMMSVVKLGTEPSMKVLLDFIKYNAMSRFKIIHIVRDLMKNYEVNSALIDIMENVVSLDYDNELMKSKLYGYCQSNSSCYDDTRISKILNEFASDAGKLNCNMTKNKNETPVGTFGPPVPMTDYQFHYQNPEILIGFSDVGHWNESFTPALTVCLESESSDVQYAALEALRSAPCNKYNYEHLLILSEKSKNNPYMDIMMYRTLIRCPTTNLSIHLKNKLTDNDVNHETSFIWTHLSSVKGSFASDILKDSSLKVKYHPSGLKFSRNFQRNFVIMNQTFLADLSVVFTGVNLNPQYMSLQISSEDTTVDLLDVEMRERNRTTRYSSKENTYCITNVKTKGVLIFSTDLCLSRSLFNFDMSLLYMLLFNLGLNVFSMFSMSFFQALFSDNYPIDYMSKDILLQYPTSIGMPFQIKLNMTQGSVSQMTNMPSFYSKQCDIQMLIDATYTNVGTKVQTTVDMLPSMNVTSTSNVGLQFIIELAEKKTKLFDFHFDLYNIENERLSPVFNKNEISVESCCVPLLMNLTGSTLCWEYRPLSQWWPITKAMYSLVYIRDDNIRGHNITVLDDDGSKGIYYQELGNTNTKWQFWMRSLAQFANIKVWTPYFNFNGSGTYATEMLRLEKPGQAMNISGLFSCNDEVAPFTLTGYNTITEKGKDNHFDVHFNSTLFETNIASSYEMKDNYSIDLTIPYRIKDKSSESIHLSAKAVEYDIKTNVSRWEVRTALALSEFPSAVVDFKLFYDETSREFSSNIDLSVNAELSYDNHSLTTKASGKWYDDYGELITAVDYECSNKTVNWTKSFVMKDMNNKLSSELLCDDEVLYKLHGNCGIGKNMNMYSNMTFVMPLEGKRYPFLQIDMDHNFDLFHQQVHFVCRKSYRDHTMKLNVTAGLVMDEATGLPAAFGELMHHRAVLEMSCDAYDPFRIDGESRLSDDLQNLDLTIDVKTPFKRWEKEAFKLKLKKTGSHLETSLQETRAGATPQKYSLEGITDVDIMTNLLDTTSGSDYADYPDYHHFF